MFIHPTQNRSLIPREAARVQSLPDWFWFPVARTHQFRIIGNAVPPLIAEAVGLEVPASLSANSAQKQRSKAPRLTDIRASGHLIATSQGEAAVRLQDIAGLDRLQLRGAKKRVFLRGWFALFYLFPGLHPDKYSTTVTRMHAGRPISPRSRGWMSLWINVLPAAAGRSRWSLEETLCLLSKMWIITNDFTSEGRCLGVS